MSGAGQVILAPLTSSLNRPGSCAGTFSVHSYRLQYPTGAGEASATIQLPGRDLLISHGTITRGQSLHDGTFALRLSGGTPLTGSWPAAETGGAHSARAKPHSARVVLM
jgi:hypothetical protein